MTTPYIGYGNDQLRDQPSYSLRDQERPIVCPNCGETHPLQLGQESKTGNLSTMVAMVHCTDGKSYLVGVAGHFVNGVKPACSGNVDLEELDEEEKEIDHLRKSLRAVRERMWQHKSRAEMLYDRFLQEHNKGLRLRRIEAAARRIPRHHSVSDCSCRVCELWRVLDGDE